MNTKIYLLLATLLTLASVSTLNVVGQVEDNNMIACEPLKNLLAELSLRHFDKIEENVDVMTTGKPAYVIIVVSPGNKKNSNAKTAQKLIHNIKFLEEKQLPGALRSVIVETKKIKGDGRFQIYFYDEKYDYAFNEYTFACP